MPDKQDMFQQIVNASKVFTQANDVDLLLERVLTFARKLSDAEAGSIYIVEDNKLRFHHTQNGSIHRQSSDEKKRIYKASVLPVNPDSIPAYVARTGEVLNIPDVSHLPEDKPFSFLRTYDGLEHYQIQSLVAFPLKNNEDHVRGVIQLINTKDESGTISALSEDSTPLVLLFGNKAANAIERTQSTRARVLGIIQILTALRDTEETVAHVNRVGAYASEIYETWAHNRGIDEEVIIGQKDTLRMAAMLHDLGKLAIPNVIRRKPGKLTDEEYDVMKQHTVKGAQLLLQYAKSEIERAAAEIALTHHEHWDGTGYPGFVDPATGDVLPGYESEPGKARGKQGEDIPLFGRLVAIADVYDSLSNPRVYRTAWPEDKVLDTLKTAAGTHFDPSMIDAFFASLDIIHAITERFQE